MLRSLFVVAAGLVLGLPLSAPAVEISGDYLETRTCDIYTGPCFANSEVGLTGRQAIMAWSIDEGTQDGVDLAGLKVVLAINASDTLALGGGMTVQPDPIKAVVLVDDRATVEQRAALLAFVRGRADRVASNIVRVDAAPIEMTTDHIKKVGHLTAGDKVEVRTRALGVHDHCCTNEVVYYPPLADVENTSPAFTIDGRFEGRGLGVRWSSPKTRSAFLGTFAY
jgi:hypothetical protein